MEEWEEMEVKDSQALTRGLEHEETKTRIQSS